MALQPQLALGCLSELKTYAEAPNIDISEIERADYSLGFGQVGPAAPKLKREPHSWTYFHGVCYDKLEGRIPQHRT